MSFRLTDKLYIIERTRGHLDLQVVVTGHQTPETWPVTSANNQVKYGEKLPDDGRSQISRLP